MPRGKKADQKKDTAPAKEMPEQTEGATPAQETPGQVENTTPVQETPEQGQEAQQDAPEPEGDGNTTGGRDAEQSVRDTQERDLFAGIPNPCVYCGPTVRGVARQYTTYQGGIPDTLRNFITEHTEARQLIVSTEQFPAYRRRLDTPGTAEAKLYKRVKEKV